MSQDRSVGTKSRVLLVAAVFSATAIGFGFGYVSGHMGGVAKVQRHAREEAEVCDTIIRMGIADWQEVVGVPLTKQVNCDAMRRVRDGVDIFGRKL